MAYRVNENLWRLYRNTETDKENYSEDRGLDKKIKIIYNKHKSIKKDVPLFFNKYSKSDLCHEYKVYLHIVALEENEA